MNLSEKIKHLREVEGELRGFGRAMTQMEVVRAMQEEMGETISQAYLSQLENGKRVHLTATSRLPTFKLGALTCARRSVLLKYIEEQERRRVGMPAKERQDSEHQTLTG